MKLPVFSATAALFSLSLAHAATIAWSSSAYTNIGGAKNTMGVDQFDQTGTQFLAVNLGGGAQTLTQTSDPDIAFTASDTNFSIASNMSGTASGVFHANLGGNNNISSSAAFTPTSQDQSSPATLQLSGLTIGHSYRIQALLMDGRGSGTLASAPGRYAEFDGGFVGVFGNGVQGSTWGDALLVTGTFTADSATQTFDIQAFGSDDTPFGGALNAILVHTTAVPEPSTLCLVGLGLASFAGLRRRG